jgi:hypothetical protein
MVALLWARRDIEAALRLEEIWSELARTLPLSIRCGYPLAAFDRDTDSAPFARICDQHTEVLPAEGRVLHVGGDLREIARLQQRASLLEGELARGRQVQESLAQLAAIVGSSDDAIVGKTLDGIVTS